MKTCDIGNTGSPLDSPQCFGAGSLRSSEEADNCRVPSLSVIEEVGLIERLGIDHSDTYGGVLPALPGCNPVQAGPENAVPQSGCGAPTVLNGRSPNVPLNPPTSTSTSTSVSTPGPTPTKASSAIQVSSTKTSSVQKSPSETPSAGVKLPNGWASSGCYSDKVNPRSLDPQPQYWGEPITSSNCVKHCDSIGKSIAGTENGGQCFCGNTLSNSVAVPGKCISPCVGDVKEQCGGPGALSLYKKTGYKARRVHKHRRGGHGIHAASWFSVDALGLVFREVYLGVDPVHMGPARGLFLYMISFNIEDSTSVHFYKGQAKIQVCSSRLPFDTLGIFSTDQLEFGITWFI